jgi:hypothetical protein
VWYDSAIPYASLQSIIIIIIQPYSSRKQRDKLSAFGGTKRSGIYGRKNERTKNKKHLYMPMAATKRQITDTTRRSRRDDNNETDESSLPMPSTVLTEAPTPPWHTSLTLVLLIAYFATCIPNSLDSIEKDIVTNQELWMHVNFPNSLSVRQMAYIRLGLGMVMILDSIYAVLYGYWDQDTEYYYPYSRLQPVQHIKFRGYMYSGSISSALMTLSSFTMWAWVLEGITFLLLGSIPLYMEYTDGMEPPPWMYRITFVFWQICAPTSMLISVIVKYVLWPAAAKAGANNNIQVLQHPGALLEHNWNVLSCLVEVALLGGGLPIRYYYDFVWAPLFGLLYVLFSHSMTMSWTTDRHHGPQFIYPFLDTTSTYRTLYKRKALLLWPWWNIHPHPFLT